MSSAATLTDEQSLALRTRDTSIALAAGAGCGKTFVLSERFLSHLDGESPLLREVAQLHQLIAITFTDAAAREMRRRIREKCYERASNAKTRSSQDAWLRLLRAIEAARVSTIHAFCASLLREHALTAGLDPGFGVLEQSAADVLVSEVIDDVLRARLSAHDPAVLDLADACGLGTLKEQLRELLNYRHGDEFQRWRTATVEDVVEAWRECYATEALGAAVAELAAGSDARRMLELLSTVAPPPEREKFVEARSRLLELLPRLAAGDLDEADVRSLRGYAVVQSVCSAKDWPTKQSFEAYRDACKRFRDALDKHLPKPFSAEQARPAAEFGLRLLSLAHEVAERYKRVKTRVGRLDFDDLLFFAKELLTNPQHAELQKRLSSELRLLLVDEFQDTDALQVELVRALCGDVAAGKLFFVGDMNQSIYRFRGAQPAVFLELRNEVPQPGQLPLTRNFRSQPAVLNFVNALFAQVWGGDYQPLRPNRAQVTAEPAVEFLWTLTPDKRLAGGKNEARGQEARRIARRLRELIDGESPIIADSAAKEGRRPLQPGDVAILFRALSDVALYETALREYDLAYYLVGGHAFYSQQEIFDVLNLLRAVASGADEISLAGVLRSPFFSLADETLFWLVESAGSLNDGLFGGSLPSQLSPEERYKTAAAAEILAELRAAKDSISVTSLLELALARTGYDAALLPEFLGQRKLANLRKLLEQARAADASGIFDLWGFIAQLAEFVAREPKEALAATRSEAADVIRLMTIHQAKGLEFPLVIVADVDRKAEFRAPVAALDPRLGPVAKLPDDESNPPATTGIDLYRQLERRADVEERKRLLYVATTRAADYLILSSSLSGFDPDDFESDWMRLLAERFEVETGQLRGTLPPGFSPPNVRVTKSDPEIDVKRLASERGRDLLALVEEARDLAASGGGTIPPDVGPIAPDVAARRQYSVSRLSGRLVRPRLDDQAEPPRALPDAIDPLALGTLVHAVLERLDPADAGQSIRSLCEQFNPERVVPNAAKCVSLAVEMLERFRGTQRWEEIAASPRVHRELEFLLAWPPAGPPSDGSYLQGFFDCVYQDSSGNWHLVDYKTNDVTAAEVPHTAQHYEMQMLLYALALETALGVPPVETVLNFLRPGVEHAFDWNDDARRRCIQLVDAAIREPILNDD